MKTVMKLSIDARKFKHKMDSEEIQEHLKLKRGNGAHKSKKDYNRKSKHKDAM